MLTSASELQTLKPDMAILKTLDCLGIIATAPGGNWDCVWCFFAPAASLNEDPVAGSPHCTLILYW